MLISNFIFSWIRFRTHEIKWSIQLLQVNICKSKHIFFSNNRDFPTTHLLFSTPGKTSARCPSMSTSRTCRRTRESLSEVQVRYFYKWTRDLSRLSGAFHWQCSLQIMANFEIMHDVTLHCQPCRQLQCVRFWDLAQSLPGSLHPLRLPPLRHVCHDELGLLLCTTCNYLSIILPIYDIS